MEMRAMLGSSGKPTDGIKAPMFDGTQVCAQIDPDAFFPESPTEYTINLRVLKPICDACFFKDPCLDYAIDNPELMGIWAGTSHKDRLLLRDLKRTA